MKTFSAGFYSVAGRGHVVDEGLYLHVSDAQDVTTYDSYEDLVAAHPELIETEEVLTND